MTQRARWNCAYASKIFENVLVVPFAHLRAVRKARLSVVTLMTMMMQSAFAKRDGNRRAASVQENRPRPGSHRGVARCCLC